MTTGWIFDIQRFSLHDGPGLRTLVFLKGCPLRCLWCSNPESQRQEPDLLYDPARCNRCGDCIRSCNRGALSLTTDGELSYEPSLCTMCGACVAVCNTRARSISGREITHTELCAVVMRDMPFYRRSGGGVTLGGGEPAQQADFVRAIIDQLRASGVDTAIETCGHAETRSFLSIATAVDHVYYDVKHAGAVQHREATGVSNELIIENLSALTQIHRDVTVRYPLVPGYNDAESDLFGLAALLRELPHVPPVELVPYHRYGEHKYRLLRKDYVLAGTIPPDTRSIDNACCLLQRCGLCCRALTH